MYKEYYFDDPILTEALTKLHVARNQFDNAETPEMVDITIFELAAAELHLKAVLKRLRDGNKNKLEH